MRNIPFSAAEFPVEELDTQLVFGPTDTEGALIITGDSKEPLQIRELGGRFDPPVNQLLRPDPAGGWLSQFVTQFDEVRITNRAMIQNVWDRPSGVAIDVWSQDPTFRPLNNDRGDYILRLIKLLSQSQSFEFPGNAGRIHRGYTSYREANKIKFRGRKTNQRLLYGGPRPDKYPNGGGETTRIDCSQYRRLADEFVRIFGESPEPNRVPAFDPTSTDVELLESMRIPGPGDDVIEASRTLMSLGCGAGAAAKVRRYDTTSTNPLMRRQAGCTPMDPAKVRAISDVKTVAQVRVAGTLRTALSNLPRAVDAVGRASWVALAAFIILDFVTGEWVAALWAAGGAVAGIVEGFGAAAALASLSITSMAATMSVGILVGVAIGAIFAILPWLLTQSPAGPMNNVTEIIQNEFWGDPKTTGNEKCNENLVTNGQTPNCTSVYGQGAMGYKFGWNAAQSSAFLIHFNEGRPMSIPDMASNFTVYDWTNPSATANSIAVIKCDKAMCYANGATAGPGGAASAKPCPATSAALCRNPIYELNMALINLPVLNQTADKIYDQIESGECKIVADPTEGEMFYPQSANGSISNSTDPPPAVTYTVNVTSVNGSQPVSVENVTFEPIWGRWRTADYKPVQYAGQPVSIACNMTADIPHIMDVNYTLVRPTIQNSPNTSTASDPTSFVAPPPPADFARLTPKDSVCLSNAQSPDNLLCLPSGTFPACYEKAFGYTTTGLDTLTLALPTDSLTLNTVLPGSEEVTTPDPRPYFSNRSADKNLKKDLSLLTGQERNMTVVANSNPAAMCIYSLPDFKGDVWCMGQGGTNFTANLQNKAQSITFSPGIVAWIYPGFYGNPLGTAISTNVADLSSIPFKTGGSFAKNVFAAWVYNATAPNKRRSLERVRRSSRLSIE